MKRLSALIIGVFMVASAQTAFGLVGQDDTDGVSATDGVNASNSGIASIQSWSQDREGSNFMKVEIGLDNHSADDDRVYLGQSDVEGNEPEYIENGDF